MTLRSKMPEPQCNYPILLAIHPRHASSILAHKKRYEYRKVLPTRRSSHLVLYATSPAQAIVGVVEVTGILTSPNPQLWEATSKASGISHFEFAQYFCGHDTGNAFVLGKVYPLHNDPISLSDLPGNRTPPQSFTYLTHEDMNLIWERYNNSPNLPG